MMSSGNTLRHIAPDNTPSFVIENAERRVFVHLAKIKEAFDNMRDHPGDQAALENLWAVMKERIE